jgi:RNA polymerase sigma-32 factor
MSKEPRKPGRTAPRAKAGKAKPERVGKARAAKAGAAKSGPRKSAASEPSESPAAALDELAESAPLEPEVVAAEVVGAPEQAEAARVLPLEPALLDGDDAEASAAGADADVDALGVPLPLPHILRDKGNDLARTDALSRYLSEISRHPLLTREDEHALAARFVATQDPAIAYRLVTANLRLVVKIAMEFRRAAFNVLDLIQEGNVGLMQAVQKYDPFRGVKLSSYAAWWIRAYILRYLMDNWRMVKLGTTQAQRKLFFNLRKEQEKLLAQGFDAAPKLLAEKLDVSEQDVREMDQRLGNDELSIDAPISSGDESRQTYGDRISEQRKGAEEQLGDEELRRVFKENLTAFGKTLTSEKDRFLFEKRIAVPEGEEPLTLQQIGEKYGFTRERARQLEARLTEQLRDYLRARLPDFAQLSLNEPESDE